MSAASNTKPKRPRKSPVAPQQDYRGEFRGIYTVLPDSPEFQILTPDSRLFIFLLKLKLGLSGINVFYLDTLAHLSGTGGGRVADGIRDLIAHDWIVVNEPIVWLRNGLRFDPANPLGYRNGCKAVVKHLLTLPKLPIVNDFLAYYCPLSKYLREEWSLTGAGPVPDPSDTRAGLVSDKGIRIRDKGKGITENGKENSSGNRISESESRAPASAETDPIRSDSDEISQPIEPIRNGFRPDPQNVAKADRLGRDLALYCREFDRTNERNGTQLRNGQAAFSRFLDEEIFATPETGSEYDRVQQRHDETPQDRAPRSGSLSRATIGPKARPDRRTEEERIRDWAIEFPDESADLQARITAEIADDPRYAEVLDSPIPRMAAEKRYRERVLELLETNDG